MMKRLLTVCLILVLTFTVAAGTSAAPLADPMPSLLERVLSWIWLAGAASSESDSSDTYPSMDPNGPSEVPTETTSTEIEDHTEGETYPNMDPNG